MPDITFVYRSNDDRRKIFQEGRRWFLYSGRVAPDDGFDTVASSDGVTSHTVSSRVVRPLAFFDPAVGFRTSMIGPGDLGFVPLNFRKGRVSVVSPRTTVVITTSSTVHQFVGGRLGITSQDTLGSLTAFSIFASTQEDPQQFYVETATDIDSGGVSQPWARMSAVFVPHRNTRYLGVGSSQTVTTGANRVQYFRKWMLEKAHIGGTFPSAYGKAREVVVTVKPDRLNLFPNPSFEVDASNIAAVTNATFARSTTKFNGAGVASLAVTVTGAGNGSVRSTITATPVKPNKVYSLSSTVVAGSTARYVNFWVEWYTSASALISTSAVTQVKEINSTNWVTAEAPGLTSPANAAYASVVVQVLGAGAGEVHYFDLFLFEREPLCLPYFDGSTSGDTIWETGGTVGKTRSYLYTNRAERYAAIKRLLSENVPMGVGIAEPKFGVLPADW